MCIKLFNNHNKSIYKDNLKTMENKIYIKVMYIM